ncbi:MAG: hypothetical protein SVX28_10875 [Pseudomonadota bacterium]|nr:hypothetical protein [Pseudomonadota bacterium]
MFKIIILVGLLSFSVALNVHADDSARIDRLEKEVQELKFRLSKLESLIGDQGEGQKVVTNNGEGWKSIANWRKLTTAMSYDDVERILGKPERVDGGNIAFWRYPNRGKVTFMRGKVESWSEPRQ